MFNLKFVKYYITYPLIEIKNQIKKKYFKTNIYNKKLISLIPSRTFYNPSSSIAKCLNLNDQKYLKIENIKFPINWSSYKGNNKEYENLHNFSWIFRVDRKSDSRRSEIL